MPGNSVILTFIGEDGPLSRTMKKVDAEANALGGGLGKLTKSIMSVGAVGGAVQGVAALGTSLVQMSGAALLAPAGIAAAGAAMVAGKLAAQGFSDALGGDAEAMAKLAPNARDTVGAINALKPAWQGVQQLVQNNAFANVAGDVKQLGSSYLPVLKSGLGGIGTGFNNIARNAIGVFKTPEAVGKVKSIVDATGSSLGHMSEFLGNGVSGFLNLAGAGAKFLAGTGGGITDLTGRFDAWTQKITSDGSFERWVKSAGEAFGQLFAVIGNIGSIVTTVISGLSGPTEGLFSSLERVTGQIRAFLESAQGQAALGALGEALRTVSSATSSILDAGLRELGPLIQAAAPVVAELATTIGGALVGAITVVGPLLTGFASFLSAVPGSASILLGVLTALWGAFKIGQAVMAGARIAAMLMAAWPTIVSVATGAWTAAQWLLNAALSANPIGIVIVVIAALVAAIVWAWNNSETFRSIVLSVWSAIQSAITVAVNVILNVIGWFGRLPGMIGGWFQGARTAAVGAFTALLGWLGGLPGRILGALGQLGNLLVSVGRDLLNGLWNGISAGWSWLTGKVSDLASSLLGAAKSALGIASPSKLFRDEVGKWIPEGMAVGITANAGSVMGALDDLTGTSVSVAAGQAAQAVNGAATASAGGGGGGGAVGVNFTGNTADALATVIMQLIRTGKIQITRQAA